MRGKKGGWRVDVEWEVEGWCFNMKMMEAIMMEGRIGQGESTLREASCYAGTEE